MNCPRCGHAVPQISLADLGPKHRATDPDTARLAALRNEPRRGSQRRLILAAIVATNHHGATADELAHTTGLPYVSVSTRISELLRGEWAIPTSYQRETRAGGSAQVVIASQAALDLFDEKGVST